MIPLSRNNAGCDINSQRQEHGSADILREVIMVAVMTIWFDEIAMTNPSRC
jgi:hypothetical protein